ncbi:MAG: glycosyltransferase family 4 protein [Deltaproteobacteria bacterium]|nr:glycosyltransferase family 4 protein [Deltaproteobacteria bacterium]
MFKYSKSSALTRTFSVLHIVPALFGAADGITGGAERYAFELARHMATEAPTRLLTFGERERRERNGNLCVRVIGRPWYVRGQRDNPIAPALFAEIRNADVVHCHQRHVLASSLTALFCRLTRRPVFVTELGGGGWDLSAYINTDRWYDGHLHISAYSRHIYRHDKLNSARMILGGVDTERFSPAEVKRQATVVYSGRLLPHKGIDILIKAMPPDATLDVIGRVFAPAYLADLRRLAIGKRVNFHHDYDDGKLVEAYRTAACVVLPSVYKTMYGDETAVPELLGQTLLEGMACASPTIATDVASLPEVVVHGETGFIVPPNDPEALRERIRWLLDHPGEAASMGAAGRRRVLAHFTWPAVVLRCLEAYSTAYRGLNQRRTLRGEFSSQPNDYRTITQ